MKILGTIIYKLLRLVALFFFVVLITPIAYFLLMRAPVEELAHAITEKSKECYDQSALGTVHRSGLLNLLPYGEKLQAVGDHTLQAQFDQTKRKLETHFFKHYGSHAPRKFITAIRAASCDDFKKEGGFPCEVNALDGLVLIMSRYLNGLGAFPDKKENVKQVHIKKRRVTRSNPQPSQRNFIPSRTSLPPLPSSNSQNSSDTQETSLFPGTFKVTVTNARIANRKQNGLPWDPAGDPPDVFGKVKIGQNEIDLPVKRNTFNPRWLASSTFYLYGNEKVYFQLWDKDFINHDLIANCSSNGNLHQMNVKRIGSRLYLTLKDCGQARSISLVFSRN